MPQGRGTARVPSVRRLNERNTASLRGAHRAKGGLYANKGCHHERHRGSRRGVAVHRLHDPQSEIQLLPGGHRGEGACRRLGAELSIPPHRGQSILQHRFGDLCHPLQPLLHLHAPGHRPGRLRAGDHHRGRLHVPQPRAGGLLRPNGAESELPRHHLPLPSRQREGL